jgi:hypothetical protein
VVLRAYCDESGTHAASPLVTMSAWMTEQPRWKHLSLGWRRVLDGPPSVREAKAADMEARQGDFKGWSAKQVEEFRWKLCRRIDAHVRFGVSLSVERADYERIVMPKVSGIDDHAFGTFRDPYVWLMACVVGLVVRSEHRKPDERVAFIFDEGHEGQANAEDFFYWMLEADPSIGQHVVRKFMTADSLDFPPLQAADQLVWGCNRGTRFDIPAGRNFIEMRGILGITTPVVGGILGVESLEYAVSNMGPNGPPWHLRKRRHGIEVAFTP